MGVAQNGQFQVETCLCGDEDIANADGDDGGDVIWQSLYMDREGEGCCASFPVKGKSGQPMTHIEYNDNGKTQAEEPRGLTCGELTFQIAWVFRVDVNDASCDVCHLLWRSLVCGFFEFREIFMY